jgi:hypothetical protein
MQVPRPFLRHEIAAVQPTIVSVKSRRSAASRHYDGIKIIISTNEFVELPYDTSTNRFE